MKPILFAFIAFLSAAPCSRAAMQLEIFALRHQLGVCQRSVKRPRLKPADRLLWAWLARLWPGWRKALVIVQPRTVVAWQRRRFRDHWTRLCRSGKRLTNKEVVGATATTWDAFVDEVQAKDGWYFILDADGERVLNRPSVLGGVIMTAPFTPDPDICGFGGTGALYAFYYETGSAYYEPILGTNPYGDDDESIVKIELDKGITSEIGLHVGKKVESTGFIQKGAGEVKQVEVDPALNIKPGIVGWQQY